MKTYLRSDDEMWLRERTANTILGLVQAQRHVHTALEAARTAGDDTVQIRLAVSRWVRYVEDPLRQLDYLCSRGEFQPYKGDTSLSRAELRGALRGALASSDIEVLEYELGKAHGILETLLRFFASKLLLA